jgi:hypothetical protein
MKKQIVTLSLTLLTAAASLAPITADASTPKIVPALTHNVKTAQAGTCVVFNEFRVNC